jgi:hypothetical protein
VINKYDHQRIIRKCSPLLENKLMIVEEQSSHSVERSKPSLQSLKSNHKPIDIRKSPNGTKQVQFQESS